MIIDALFEKAGFVNGYRSEFEAFYRPYFENESALNDFFCSVFQNDSVDKKPRWMMNHILWFVTLSKDIDKIRPGRDPLRIMFLRICLESICKICGLKSKAFFDSFETYFSDAGKQYILSNFVFTGIDVPDDLTGIDRARFKTHSNYQLTLSDFLSIIKATRDMVAHDGNYWSVQFFARDTDGVWLTNITTDEKIISCQPAGTEMTYCFDTTMQYDLFEKYFVEACINYLRSYIHGITHAYFNSAN